MAEQALAKIFEGKKLKLNETGKPSLLGMYLLSMNPEANPQGSLLRKQTTGALSLKKLSYSLPPSASKKLSNPLKVRTKREGAAITTHR